MDFDLGSRGSKFKKEQERRRAVAKSRLAKERETKTLVDQKQKEEEERQRLIRVERLKKEEEAEAQRLEIQRKTGGVAYDKVLKARPTTNDGDRITLPPSALAELSPQDALEKGAMTFELSVIGDRSSESVTHCGALEFVAEEGWVGLPPKVVHSLFPNGRPPVLAPSIRVRYVRMPRGRFARLQPLGEGFRSHDVDMKGVLESALKTHTTLTVGDILLLPFEGRVVKVAVRELLPEKQITVINTDVEVEIMLSEEAERAQEAKKVEEEKKKEEDALNARKQMERRARKLRARESLPEEPPKAEDVLHCQVKTPGGATASRRFRRSDKVEMLFNFVDGLEEDDIPDCFRLAATFPRRTIQGLDKHLSLEEAGLSNRQEVLFIEGVDEAEGLSGKEGRVEDRTGCSISPPKTSNDPGPLAEEMDVDTGDDQVVTDHFIEDNPQPTSGDAHDYVAIEALWGKAQEEFVREISTSTNAEEEMVPIHAEEPDLPQRSDFSLGHIKWEAQLRELESMGFSNVSLNISLLEKYQGRLLRVVNYLSELQEKSALS